MTKRYTFADLSERVQRLTGASEIVGAYVSWNTFDHQWEVRVARSSMILVQLRNPSLDEAIHRTVENLP